MWLQFRFRNETAGVAVNRLQCSDGKRSVEGDSQGLSFARGQRSAQLAMAAARGDDFKGELYQRRSDVAAGQLLKPQ